MSTRMSITIMIMNPMITDTHMGMPMAYPPEASTCEWALPWRLTWYL
jgi:hypothetical protein